MAENQQVMAESLANGGRDAALAECIRRYGPLVRRTAWRITGDGHLAEDVCQAVFLVLVKNRERNKDIQFLGAWLYRVAVLTSRKAVEAKVRRQKREQEAGMSARSRPEPPAQLPAGVDQAIDRLPEIYRRVIVAHYFEGQSYAEVAVKLGVSEETVKKRGIRGIDRLRRQFGSTMPGLTAAALVGLLAAEAAASAPLAAAQVAAIQAAVIGHAAPQVAGLAHATLQAVFWGKVKTWAAVIAAMAVTVAVPVAGFWPRNDSTLVGIYAFDEGTGTKAADASLVGNHGELIGGVAWIDGRKGKGKALNFDGVTGHVKLDQDLNRWLGGTATVAFWIKTTQVGNSDPMWNAPCVVGVEVKNSFNDVQWGWLDGTGRIGVNAGTGQGARGTFSKNPINDGAWHHVALTRDAPSGQVQVYVEGTLNATGTSGVGVKTSSFYTIGRIEAGSRGKPVFFRGALDEFRIYNRVLSAGEIRAMASE